MIENADGSAVAARPDLAEDFHVLGADAERQDLAALFVALEIHAVEVETEQMRFHQLDRRGEAIEMAVTVVQVVHDADVFRAVVGFEILADGNHVLRLPGPAAVVVDADLAAECLCHFENGEKTLGGVFDFFLLRRALLFHHDPELRAELVFFEKGEGLLVLSPEGEELDPVFLIREDLAFELRDMLLPPVVGDLRETHLRDHLGPGFRRALLRVKGHDAPGREVGFFEGTCINLGRGGCGVRCSGSRSGSIGRLAIFLIAHQPDPDRLQQGFVFGPVEERPPAGGFVVTWIVERAGIFGARAVGKRRLPGQRGLAEAGHDVRVLLGLAVQFHRLARNVVEFDAAAVGIEEQLPVAVADREHGAAVEQGADAFEPPFPEQGFGAEVPCCRQQGCRKILSIQLGSLRKVGVG